MLVLTRKRGQRFMIGAGIAVVVRRIGRRRVDLGVDAPAEVAVYRAELLSPDPTCSPDAATALRDLDRDQRGGGPSDS